jgi:hypothetical protein
MFAKIYNFEIYEQLTEPHRPLDLARDHAHYGPITHINIANNFLKT